MSRLENKAVMGYFEIDPKHYEAIFSIIKPVPGGKLLDPFAGEGKFAVAAADTWGMDYYLNELDKIKATEMIEKYGHENVVQGDAEHLHTRNNAFSVVWCNPPYDQDTVAGNANDAKRVEYQLLRTSWKWAQVGGLVMWVVYSHHLTERAAMFLATNSSTVDVWALPGKHLDWNQIIVIARKQGFTVKPEVAETLYGNILAQKENPFKLVPHAEPFYTNLPRPFADKGFYFTSSNPDPVTVGRIIAKDGAWTTTGFQTLIAVPQEPVFTRPIHQPRPGHAALVLAGGGMDGELIEDVNHGTSAIRAKIAHFEEVVDYIVEDAPSGNSEESIKKTVIANKPRTKISLLNHEGRIVQMVGDEAILDFIVNNRTELSQRINDKFVPLYNFDFNGEAFKGWLDKLRLMGKYKFYTSQKHVISAVVKAFESIDGVLLVGQMGSGKTSMGSTSMIAIAEASTLTLVKAAVEQQRVATDMRPDQIALVVAPPHLSRKWEREAQSLSRNAFIRIAKRYADVKKFMEDAELRPDQPKVLILKRSLIAAGSPAQSGAKWIRRAIALWGQYDPTPEGRTADERIYVEWIPTCPTTGEVIRDRDGNYASDEWIRKNRYYVNDLYPVWQDSRTTTESSPAQRDAKREAGKNSTLPSLGELLAERISAERVEQGKAPLRTNYVIPFPEVVSRYFAEEEYMPAKNPGYRLDEYILRNYSDKVYLMAWDEVHEAQNSDSGRGEAFTRLASVATKKLALTGTPVNGKASSMFNLMYSLVPQTKILYPWGGSKRFAKKDRTGEVERKEMSGDAVVTFPEKIEGYGSTKGYSESRWVSDMGVRERIVEEKPTYDKETGAYTGTRKYKRPYEEAPGVSPLLISYILPNSIFISLKDMGRKALPSYEEIAVPVEMDADVADMYRKTDDKLKAYMLERRWEGDNSFGGAYQQWAMGWHNQPYEARQVIHRVRDKVSKRVTPKVVVELPSLGKDRMYAKEQVLFDMVSESLANGRPSIVYIAQSDTRDIRPRIAEILSSIPGAKPYILDKTISTDRREAVIEKQVQEGCNILITHPGLVETGLDLLHFPDIYVYEIVLRLATLMQATARAFRLNQTHSYCRVFYLYNEETMEERAVQLMSKKQRASKLLTGDLGLTGLDALTEREDSFERQLLNTIASDVADLSAANLFKSTQGQTEVDQADLNFWLIGDDQNQDEDEEEIEIVQREMTPKQQELFDAMPRHEESFTFTYPVPDNLPERVNKSNDLMPVWLAEQLPVTNLNKTAEGEAIVYAHYFMAGWDLWVGTYNPNGQDMLCWSIENNDWVTAEWGIQFLWYLQTVKGTFGVELERDIDFEPMPLGEAIAEWKQIHSIKEVADAPLSNGYVVAVGDEVATPDGRRGTVDEIVGDEMIVTIGGFSDLYPIGECQLWATYKLNREAVEADIASDLVALAEVEFGQDKDEVILEKETFAPVAVHGKLVAGETAIMEGETISIDRVEYHPTKKQTPCWRAVVKHPITNAWTPITFWNEDIALIKYATGIVVPKAHHNFAEPLDIVLKVDGSYGLKMEGVYRGNEIVTRLIQRAEIEAARKTDSEPVVEVVAKPRMVRRNTPKFKLESAIDVKELDFVS